LEQHGQEQQASSQQHNTGKNVSIEKVLYCIVLYIIVEQTRPGVRWLVHKVGKEYGVVEGRGLE
jgi:hypothetical protein